MRGPDTFTEGLFTMRRLDDFVPADHPLRRIRVMVNEALAKMDELFSRMYEADVKGGRPSIAPEKLLRAMLLQILFSIRSERQLMEQTQYNMLFRWFIGLAMDDAVWVPTVFSKNRQRLIEHDAVVAFFNEVLETAENKDWLSGEHFRWYGRLPPRPLPHCEARARRGLALNGRECQSGACVQPHNRRSRNERYDVRRGHGQERDAVALG